MDEKVIACPDCGWKPDHAVGSQSIAPRLRYCPNCSQELRIEPLNLAELATEFLGAFASWEFPILRTSRDLLRGPGKVADAWIAGKRRTYINPIKFIIIVGLIVALSHDRLAHLQEVVRAEGQATYQATFARYAPQYFAFACILVLLPVAWILGRACRMIGVLRPWLDWYVLGLYSIGLGVALQLVCDVLRIWWPDGALYQGFLVVEGLLPFGLMLWGAYAFVPGRGRIAAVVLCLLTLLGTLGALRAIGM